MGVKYHKIRNVEKSVCTCEQKIAYNIAWQVGLTENDKYQRAKADRVFKSITSGFISDCIRWGISLYEDSYNRSDRYDIDTIFGILLNGMEDYFDAGCPILASYEAIGKMFPVDEA